MTTKPFGTHGFLDAMDNSFKLVWAVFLSLVFCASVEAAGRPKVGDSSPLLQATELLQAPEGAKMGAESLRGKVVILEFWATWCGPCVAAIPHLNELAEEFKDKPVQFISITAEERPVVEDFLAKRPMKSWVALDTNKAMNLAYGIGGIPSTVVLDKEGKIAALTYPTSLTENHINDSLAGKKIALGNDVDQTVPAQKEKEAPPLFQVLIRPSSFTNAQGRGSGGGRLQAAGYTVRDILPAFFDTHDDRIVTNGPLPAGRFDFVVIEPHNSDVDPEVLMQEAVKMAFGLAVRRETNQVNAFVLNVVQTNAPGLTPSPTRNVSFNSRLGSIAGVGISSRKIASVLETLLNTPVVDETRLTNDFGYDISLKWEQKWPQKPDPDILKKAVREQLGLELVLEQRPIEMLVVEKAKGSETEAKR